jgi:hypothetical protein
MRRAAFFHPGGDVVGAGAQLGPGKPSIALDQRVLRPAKIGDDVETVGEIESTHEADLQRIYPRAPGWGFSIADEKRCEASPFGFVVLAVDGDTAQTVADGDVSGQHGLVAVDLESVAAVVGDDIVDELVFQRR